MSEFRRSAIVAGWARLDARADGMDIAGDLSREAAADFETLSKRSAKARIAPPCSTGRSAAHPPRRQGSPGWMIRNWPAGLACSANASGLPPWIRRISISPISIRPRDPPNR
ncbi:hypothetical protein [Parasphingorhabdus sp.]|uniref:hypothetical protein n=1 Tax=Parasphingorhabdus sp. TaxID=2709688 RepID=UPI0035948260